MEKLIDFPQLIQKAWQDYDHSRKINQIEEISARVSTNHVFKILLKDGGIVIGKISLFGKYEHFMQDHRIVNALAINLPPPYDNFLAKSLTKEGQLYSYYSSYELGSAWVVFYNPIRIGNKADRKQSPEKIAILGEELARFHKTCTLLRHSLPKEYKNTKDDIMLLLNMVAAGTYKLHASTIEKYCHIFLDNCNQIGAESSINIPVFIDWNIGNFSVDQHYRFYSRWDYDWFRMSNRVMDFYFFSRVCSRGGDQSVFSYMPDTLVDDGFLHFLRNYHKVFPLNSTEILLIKEAYRFFLLNYVIKDGIYFFQPEFAERLQKEVLENHLPRLDQVIQSDIYLKALNL